MPITMRIDELAEAVDGKILNQEWLEERFDVENFHFHGIGTDTRQSLEGQLFVPFSGENFDAHNFLEKAIEQKASILLVHKNSEDLKKQALNVGVVEVDDTLVAFQKLSHYWRHKMTATIIGITGSNGKTTTKEFAATILQKKYEVSWSQKSFNNHWGVPISLLSMEEQHECALIEMGMNHAGELQKLCEIADPDVVVLTFVGASHLEGLGSIENVAKAKEEIYQHSSNQAQRVFNLDNEYTKEMYERLGNKSSITFSEKKEDADIFLKVVDHDWTSITVQGKIRDVSGEKKLSVFGPHHVVNIMAAAAIGLSVGMEPSEIWSAMEDCKTSWGRGQWYEHPEKKSRILFDAYNANPESMRALFASVPQKKEGRLFAILGEMKELGEHSSQEHQKLGELVGSHSVERVWFVGPQKEDFLSGLQSGGFLKKSVVSKSYEEELALEFASVLEPEDIVLVKGSRGVALERVLQTWGID